MKKFILEVVYNAGQNAPIKTLTSTHVIEDESDLDVVCGFLDTFSEISWGVPELLNALVNGKYTGEKEEITFKKLTS